MCDGYKYCTQHPVFVVSIHRINMCNKPPGPTAQHRLCSACTRAAAYCIGESIGEAYESMPEHLAGQVLRCTSCQRLINGLHDVFSVEWIQESHKAEAAAG